MSLAHKGALAWNKGKTGIYTDEVKKKMGVKPIGFTGPNLGKKFSAETRKKLSLSHIRQTSLEQRQNRNLY